jgi:flagellar basal body-associated protein FliL
MPEEEVLGEDDATQEQDADDGTDEEDEGGGGLLSFAGGLNSTMVRIILGAIGVVALVFITIGVSYWTMQTWFLNSQPEQGNQQQQQDMGTAQEPYQQFALEDDFIITKQMPGTGRPRTLKVSVVLAFNQENAPVQQELDQRRAQIRDRIFQILGQKNAEELGYENMQGLKDELVNEINKMLTSQYRIQAVYFNNYVYQ